MEPYEQAMALSGMAFSYFAGGDHDRAQSAFAQSLTLFREASDSLRGALTAAHLGHVLATSHDDKQALDVLGQARDMLGEAEAGPLTGPERVLHLLAAALVDNSSARSSWPAPTTTARRTPDRFTMLISTYGLALSSHAQGDLDGAAGRLREGLSLAAEAGDEPAAAYYLEALASLARQQGNPARAASLLASAAAQLQASGSGWLPAYVPRGPTRPRRRSELRAQLGDAAYEQAAADGQSRTGRRAIQHGPEGAT